MSSFDHAELERAIEGRLGGRAMRSGRRPWRRARRDRERTLEALDKGALRVAERQPDGAWRVNQWAKKAVLLGFRLSPMAPHAGGPGGALVGQGGQVRRLDRAVARRRVPRGAGRGRAPLGLYRARCGADALFVNVGAHVGEGTMVDTWATVGSCAQIGANATSRAAPASAACSSRCRPNPVIIEDNCFVGARSEVAEGVIVGEGAVLGMGVFLGQSTKIVDRPPARSSWPGAAIFGGRAGAPARCRRQPGPALYCAVIVKTVDERTRSKTSINELLRD